MGASEAAYRGMWLGASEARTAAKVQPQHEEAPEKGGNGSSANFIMTQSQQWMQAGTLSVPENSRHPFFSFLTRQPEPSLLLNKITSSRLGSLLIICKNS